MGSMVVCLRFRCNRLRRPGRSGSDENAQSVLVRGVKRDALIGSGSEKYQKKRGSEWNLLPFRTRTRTNTIPDGTEANATG